MPLLNLSRPILRDLELTFKPGLSTVTWSSEDLEEYYKRVQHVIIIRR